MPIAILEMKSQFSAVNSVGLAFAAQQVCLDLKGRIRDVLE